METKGPPYIYTKLRDLPASGRVHVYGVVRSVNDIGFGPTIQLQDENTSVPVKISEKSSKYFDSLLPNDILRLHRAQIGTYHDESVLLVDVNNSGCHAVAWRGQSDTPHVVTSNKYTLTDADIDRSDSKNTPDYGGLIECYGYTTFGESVFQLVLGVYKAKGEPFTVFIRAWDGTKPRFPAWRNMFHADAMSIDVTYCEIPATLYHAIEAYTVDICCYGDWAKKAAKLQIRDVVHLCNVRNYTSQSNRSSAITVHEGGLQFGRALDVLDEENPKHFEISKQCADALSVNFGSSNATLGSDSTVNLTPIVPENVVAQSTPVLSGVDCMKVITNSSIVVETPEAVVQSAVRKSPQSESLDFCQPSTSKQPHLATLNYEENIEVCNDMSERTSFAGQKEVRNEEEGNFEGLTKKIIEAFSRSNFTRRLEKLRKPAVFPYSLTDEMEKMLELNVGDHVYFVNFAVASLETLKDADYLRNSLVFTAKCATCGNEVIVQRSSKARCPKCFVERKLLSDVILSYRITVPVEYKRRDGTPAPLLLEIAREVWAALPGSPAVFGIDHVMKLYLEKNLREFVTHINHMIRFVEAVVKARKLRVHRAKIHDVNKSNGSLTLFVDSCEFAPR
ncbi:hypothetical protein NECAME_01356 [Necator americanus]|uniref:Protection of telomeres protein 1 ssDNA-binding domain-containing protein n=1 Tax=Necator americanus TaxID=51031 RepID=W2TWK0_NECAM|nr:hypothetical protein NECAME_01356 [Necator americanus]ETN86228.1 hypothetical protein NECAME_01356 [Necator americanus]